MYNQLSYFKCPWCNVLNPIINPMIYKIYKCGNYYDGIIRGCNNNFKLIEDLENYNIYSIKN